MSIAAIDPKRRTAACAEISQKIGFFWSATQGPQDGVYIHYTTGILADCLAGKHCRLLDWAGREKYVFGIESDQCLHYARRLQDAEK